MRHILITNDFPPKVGGIQTYLGEIYRRLDPESFMVVTTDSAETPEYDAAFPAPIVRLGKRLLPTPRLAARLRSEVQQFRPEAIVYDPILPIGSLRERLGIPYLLIAHGAEVRVPAYLPALRQELRRTIEGSLGVIAAGGYPAQEVSKLVRTARIGVVAPGIDTQMYSPASASLRMRLRAKWMVEPDEPLVVFVSRLVPRKGADTLLRALAELPPDLRCEVHIVGDGRDRSRLERLASGIAQVTRFHGRLNEAEKIELYQAADLFVFPARDRWFGIEAEGFGIVILEAQACGVPAVIGASGGTVEALAPDSGEVLRRGDPTELAAVMRRLLADSEMLVRRRAPASAYVREHFDYDQLSTAYGATLDALAHG